MDTQIIIMVIVWLIIAVTALLIEIFTAELVSFWFVVGAVVTIPFVFIPSFDYYFQIPIFLGVSGVTLVIFKLCFASKLKKKFEPTNGDMMIGKNYILTVGTTSKTLGALKIRDVTWSVSSEEVIEAGQEVRVIKTSGNTLFVESVKGE